MSLKKSVTKGDKKKKKEVDAEIESLEKNFEEKCKLDLLELDKKPTFAKSSPTKVETEATNEPLASDEAPFGLAEKSAKASKAKKRKEKKENKDQERENMIALQEIANKTGPAFLELTKIIEKLKVKGLRVKDVISDGNCMYYAVADQLHKQALSNKNCQALRELTCDYMLEHRHEFQPYLCGDDGDMLDERKYDEYCTNIRDTLVWGGQIELKALSDALNVLIEVIQAEGGELIIGDTCDKHKPKLTITFHRHMLSSSHYNSTEDDVKTPEDD